MARLEHSPGTTGAFTHNGQTWQIDDGILVVEDADLAETLVAKYTKLSFAGDETSDTSKEPTFRCGVNDCSRTVDSETATCWQH